MSEKKNNKSLIIKAICLGVLIIIICVVVWFLTHKNETHYTVSRDEVDTSALKCTSTNGEDALLFYKTSQRNEYVLRFSFRDDKLSQLSYEYNSVYNSDEAASSASADLFQEYVVFMKEHGVERDSLNPNFAPVKSKLKITLYWDLTKGLKPVSPIFFMTEEEYDKLDKSGNSDIKKMYEAKGFSCTVAD